MTKLGKLLSVAGMFDFMRRNLRFPNMKVTVVDYVNAYKYPGAVAKLNKYRTDMGIPTPDEKIRILNNWKPIWAKIPKMGDEELQRRIDQLKKMMAGAVMDSRWSGDPGYEQQLGNTGTP